MLRMELAYLSLGSNLGDRSANLRRAIRYLGEIGHVDRASSFYETEPIEMVEQDLFLNCAVALQTEASAQELLADLLKIEREMGRIRSRSKGPRVIDIDILLFGNQNIEMPGLSIPHPAMHKRRFVLVPMAEIAPDVLHPALGRTIRELLADLATEGQAVRRVEEADLS